MPLFIFNQSIFAYEVSRVPDSPIACVYPLTLNDTTQKRKPVPYRLQIDLARMQIYAKPLAQECAYIRQKRFQHVSLARNENKVIYISPVTNALYT